MTGCRSLGPLINFPCDVLAPRPFGSSDLALKYGETEAFYKRLSAAGLQVHALSLEGWQPKCTLQEQPAARRSADWSLHLQGLSSQETEPEPATAEGARGLIWYGQVTAAPGGDSLQRSLQKGDRGRQRPSPEKAETILQSPLVDGCLGMLRGGCDSRGVQNSLSASSSSGKTNLPVDFLVFLAKTKVTVLLI